MRGGECLHNFNWEKPRNLSLGMFYIYPSVRFFSDSCCWRTSTCRLLPLSKVFIFELNMRNALKFLKKITIFRFFFWIWSEFLENGVKWPQWRFFGVEFPTPINSHLGSITILSIPTVRHFPSGQFPHFEILVPGKLPSKIKLQNLI